MPVADARPDPDKLLERLQLDETKAKRGKLHIFFGASAGVGKTYAMLNAARSARSAGTDVVVGLVETHGRAETAALLEGLEVLPRKPIDHRGSRLDEFDLDAALARHPESSWSTNWRIPTRPDRVTRNAARTSRSCCARASTSIPPSTSSTWKA